MCEVAAVPGGVVALAGEREAAPGVAFLGDAWIWGEDRATAVPLWAAA